MFIRSFLLIIFIFFTSCIRAPEKPNWEFELTFPISERTYWLGDLADVQVTSLADSIFRDTLPENRVGFYNYNDTLIFYLATKFQTQTFYDQLTTTSQSAKSFNYRLDTITVEPRQCGEVLFDPLYFGLTVNSPIPSPVAFDTIKALDSIGRGFDWIDYFAGNIYAIVHNRLPTIIRVFQLKYFDEDNNFVGTSPQISAIPPFSNLTIPIIIDNPPRRIYNRMRVKVVGQLDTTSTIIRTTDSVYISIKTDTLKALGVRGELPIQVAVADTFIQTEINDEIYSADIRSGSIQVTIANHSGVTLDSVWVAFPEITLNHQPLRRFYREIVSTHIDTIDIRGYHVELPRPQLGETQKIHSIGRAYTRPTQPNQFITLLLTDNIELQYEVNELKFSRFRGIPDSINWDFDPTYEKVSERPNGNLNIQLNSANFIVIPRTNATNVPAIMDFAIHASNPNGQTATFSVINQYFPSLNAFRVFPNAHPILNLVPDSIITTGNIRLGKQFIPNMPEINVTEEDSIYGKFLIESPMVFTINDQVITTDPVEGHGEERPILFGNIFVECENKLPIGGTIHFEVTNDTTRPYRRIASTQIVRPAINRATRRAISTVSFVDTIPLPDSVIQIFKRRTFFARQILEINGSGSDTLLGYVQDFLRVKSKAKFTVDAGGLE